MQQARERAREERARIGDSAEGLLERLVLHLESAYSVSLVAMTPAQMQGSDAEVDGDRILRFRETLTEPERLMHFAHELGHLVLHKRLVDRDIVIDEIVASAYGDAGPGAIARYSPRVREEAEAKAFAHEFLCPAALALDRWRAGTGDTTISSLAADFHVDGRTATIQLANALYDLATSSNRPKQFDRGVVVYTDEQVRAARHLGSAALVDAGPGTGKTATLLRRLEFALDEHQASPGQVLALTFSNEAARELHDRIEARFGTDSARQMTISTFHGFGMEMLRWHRHRLDLPDNFTLLDEDGQTELILELLGRVQCDTLDPIHDPNAVAIQLVRHIDHLKHRRITVEDFKAAVDAWTPAEKERDGHAASLELLEVYREYEREKAARGRVDMADLILLPLSLLEDGGDIQQAYIDKYSWILVDEFQDVTHATGALLRAVAGGKRHPWVVGDARQAIYQFLGAAPENVTEFASMFPGSATYRLRDNHRASEAIVAAANQLASLFPAQGTTEMWRSVADIESLGDSPVSVAEASSDYAEAEGIADQVVEWRESGVQLGDIAVLARRHLDVRSVILALTRRGVKAESAGLLTSDGAAGDLAVVLTLASKRPAASLPRLAQALARDRYSQAETNSTIEHLLRLERTAGGQRPVVLPGVASAAAVGSDLLAEVDKARKCAERDRYHADGFDCLMTFLFEGSAYLRRLLDADDSAGRSMTLMEIVSTLSLATAYRLTHAGEEGGDTKQHQRYGFADRMRVRLTETVPIPIAPLPRRDSVRVMTCHASKGLEFPCVIVAGQTMPTKMDSWDWLPATCRPDPAESTAQANALLFVGVTRAKRAVVISHPRKATDRDKSRPKPLVPLLESWAKAFDVPRRRWESIGGSRGLTTMGSVWGDPHADGVAGRRSFLKPSALGDGLCRIRFYLEDVLGLRFPDTVGPLYPVWFDALRSTLRDCAKNAIAGVVTPAQALSVFDQRFDRKEHGEHPHFEMYRRVGDRIVRAFAAVFKPLPGTTYLDPEFELTPSNSGKPVRLDLIARFREPGGGEVVLGFRPESKRKNINAKKGTLSWTNVGTAKIPYVLAWQNSPGASGRIFSGRDAEVHRIAWKEGGMEGEVAAVTARHAELMAADYSHTVDEYMCERRCGMRVTCPYWIDALPS
jgi:superfamily I DNA/RNA helicase